MNRVKAREVRVGKSGVVVKAAILFDAEGFVHSAMLSNVSLWSAGQRVSRARKRKVMLMAEPVELSISWAFVQKLMKSFQADKRLLRKVEKNKQLVSEYGI